MARLAMVDGRVVAWRGQRPPGRGASIHPTKDCVEEAARKGAFSRAFKQSVKGVETGELLERIAAASSGDMGDSTNIGEIGRTRS